MNNRDSDEIMQLLADIGHELDTKKISADSDIVNDRLVYVVEIIHKAKLKV